MDIFPILKSFLPHCKKYFKSIKINSLDIQVTPLDGKILRITKSETEKLLKGYGFTISD